VCTWRGLDVWCRCQGKEMRPNKVEVADKYHGTLTGASLSPTCERACVQFAGSLRYNGIENAVSQWQSLRLRFERQWRRPGEAAPNGSKGCLWILSIRITEYGPERQH